jgi:hypothetical protein
MKFFNPGFWEIKEPFRESLIIHQCKRTDLIIVIKVNFQIQETINQIRDATHYHLDFHYSIFS